MGLRKIFGEDGLQLPLAEIPTYLELVDSKPKATQAVIFLLLGALNGSLDHKFPISDVKDYDRHIELLTNAIVNHLNDNTYVDIAVIIANSDLHFALLEYREWLTTLKDNEFASKKQEDRLMGYAVMFDTLQEILLFVGRQSEEEISALLEDIRLEKTGNPASKLDLTVIAGTLMFKIMRKLQQAI